MSLPAVSAAPMNLGYASPLVSGYLPAYNNDGLEPSRAKRIEKTMQLFLPIILSFSFLETESAQRILLKTVSSTIQKRTGLSLTERIGPTLFTVTPLIVLYTSVIGPEATERRNRTCSLSLDTGEGIQVKTKYYYNRDTDTCETFTYQGSGGNDNKFKTKEDCEFQCRPFSTEGKEALRAEIFRSQIKDGLNLWLSDKLSSLETVLYFIFLATKGDSM